MKKQIWSLDSMRFMISAGTFFSVLGAIVWASSAVTNLVSDVAQVKDEIESLQDYRDTDRKITNEINISLARLDEKLSIVIETLKKNQ